MNYFLGSNTAKGFVGYYNDIDKKSRHLFILKGGSGVGKHTFMKKTADFLAGKGIEAEYCHCSNDRDSLDGVIFPSIGISMIDGTSPHTVDPQLPACFDEIIDLGKYIDEGKVAPHKERIMELSAAKKSRYKRAYTYLDCARAISEDTAGLVLSCADMARLERLLSALPRTLLKDSGRAKGRQTDIFASAYTSRGYTDYLATLVKGRHTIGIRGWHCLTAPVIGGVLRQAVQGGEAVYACHNPLNPALFDHLIFKDTALISVNELSKHGDTDETVDIRDVVSKDRLMDVQQDIEWNNARYDELIEKAVKTMASCALFHKELESIYTPAVDFDGVNGEWDRTTEKIVGYIR